MSSGGLRTLKHPVLQLLGLCIACVGGGATAVWWLTEKYRIAPLEERLRVAEKQGGQSAAPPTSDLLSRSSDRMRVVVEGVTLTFTPSGAVLDADVSISNVGEGTLLISDVSVVVNCLAQDGRILAARYDLAHSAKIAPNSAEPLGVKALPVRWQVMGKDTPEVPSLNTHHVSFYVHINGRDAKSGEELWLDIDIPHPIRMNCRYPCVAVDDLKVTVREFPVVKCTADFVLGTWRLDCFGSVPE